MRLAEPYWLFLLFLLPMVWLLSRRRARIPWPTLQGFGRERFIPRVLVQIPLWLRLCALALVVVALARPQSVGGQVRVTGKGVAIMAVLDHSPSMNTEIEQNQKDRQTRLEVAKATLIQFVKQRPDDLLGLVVFANYPDRTSPLTLEHDLLIKATENLAPSQAGDSGTNIGDAIAWGLEDLRSASTLKKVLILITDGRNNPAVPHPLDPETAAKIGKGLGVTLHSIAIGAPDGIARAQEPVTGLDLVEQADGPDLALLERVASIGGGHAYNVTNAQQLKGVFEEIDRLEKSTVQGEVRTRYREEYHSLVGAALLFLLLDRLLSAGVLRRLP